MRSASVIILLISAVLFLSSCGDEAGTPAESSLLLNSAASEEEDAPRREMVTSYGSLTASREPDLVCRTVAIRNVSLDRITDTISRVIPNMIAVKNEESGSIILRASRADVDEAEKLISALDKKIPQIYIEGQVVEVTESGLSDIGIMWGKEQGNFKFSVDRSSGVISQSDNIVGAVSALIASGKAKMLANPKITALDGKEAEINIGSRVPYAVPSGATLTSTLWSVQYIDAGVSLKITSNVASDQTIVSTIRPEVSNISEWRTTAAGEFPVISTRNASVTVRIKDGETLVIGGLINEAERENISGIPGLSEIPLVGQLFQRNVKEKSKSDVLFLITPHLMN